MPEDKNKTPTSHELNISISLNIPAPIYSVTRRVGALAGTLARNRCVQADLLITAVGVGIGLTPGFPEPSGAIVMGMLASLVRPWFQNQSNEGRIYRAVRGEAVDRTQYDAWHFIVPLTTAIITGKQQLPSHTQPNPDGIRADRMTWLRNK